MTCRGGPAEAGQFGRLPPAPFRPNHGRRLQSLLQKQAETDRTQQGKMKKISPLAAIFLTVFVDLVGFGIIVPLLPFYAEHFHASPETVTLLMAIYSLMQFFSAPLWGALSDRHGRKPVLLASLLGIGLSYLWLAFAHSLWALFAARALAGNHGGQYRRGAGLYRRCDAPGEARPGHGSHRRRLRPGLHPGPGHRRSPGRGGSGRPALPRARPGGRGPLLPGFDLRRGGARRNPSIPPIGPLRDTGR